MKKTRRTWTKQLFNAVQRDVKQFGTKAGCKKHDVSSAHFYMLRKRFDKKPRIVRKGAYSTTWQWRGERHAKKPQGQIRIESDDSMDQPQTMTRAEHEFKVGKLHNIIRELAVMLP